MNADNIQRTRGEGWNRDILGEKEYGRAQEH